MVVSLSPQRPYLHPGSSPPEWPAGSCGCATGSTWVQADPEPPLPAIPPHSTVLSAHSPARIPVRTCADSHAKRRGKTEKHAFNKYIPSGWISTHSFYWSKRGYTTMPKYSIKSIIRRMYLKYQKYSRSTNFTGKWWDWRVIIQYMTLLDCSYWCTNV